MSWRISSKRGLSTRCATLRLLPVKKLSTQSTSSPSASRRSQRCEPRKPAPPVTRIRFMKAPCLKRPAQRERARERGIGRRGAPGCAVDLRSGLARKLARKAAHDSLGDRVGGRQHDEVGLERRLQLSVPLAERAYVRRHRARQEFGTRLEPLRRLEIAAGKLALARLESGCLAQIAGADQRGLLLDQSLEPCHD